jgi:hypothetical protein
MQKFLISIGWLFALSACIYGSYPNCHKWVSCTATNDPNGHDCVIDYSYQECNALYTIGIPGATCGVGTLNEDGTRRVASSCHCTCLTVSHHKGTSVSWVDDHDTVVVKTDECLECKLNPKPNNQAACEEDELYWNSTTNTCLDPDEYGCTTQGWAGGCPPGTALNAYGWCCAQLGCELTGWFWDWSFTNSRCQQDSMNSVCSSDQWGFWNSRFDCQWVYGDCQCYNSDETPIIVDVRGNGFDLTDASNGVNFDLDNHAKADRFSWTASGTDDALLVLDQDGNGSIDNGSEMFGSAAHQTVVTGVSRNGFLALAEFDKPANGGNGDGIIDSRDAVFANLRLWEDINHNGISEPSELHTLPELGVESITLDYRESRRTDRYGNAFRYRAKVYGTNHRDLGRWAYDVILVKGT